MRGTVSTILVRPLAFALASIEGALDALYRATDLTPEILADAEARVSPAQFCVAWSEAARLTGDAALGLTLAESIPQGAFGIVEYVCRSAPTAGDALKQWVRYLGILDDAVDVALIDIGGDDVSLRVTRESEAPAPASHELCFGLLMRHANAMLDAPLEIRRVNFAHARGRAADRYAAFFGANVAFSAPHTELVIAKRALRAPLKTQDPALLAILLPTADAALDRGPCAPLTAGVVRRRIQESLRSDEAELESIARALGLTGRSLQRRLKDEGTSFQRVRDEARKALADRYLDQGHSMSEIAFLLGFSEPSAFFRAFKRWTGTTPTQRLQRPA
jgi:AraC-like DNA-binding protein